MVYVISTNQQCTIFTSPHSCTYYGFMVEYIEGVGLKEHINQNVKFKKYSFIIILLLPTLYLAIYYYFIVIISQRY